MATGNTASLDSVQLAEAYRSGTSAYRLAKDARVSIWSILKRLREAGVEIRPDGVRKTLGLTHKGSQVFRELVDGLLLGDGSISRNKPSLRIEQSLVRDGWLDDLERRFLELGVEVGSTMVGEKTKVIQGRQVVKKPSRVLYLPLCEEVRAERSRWYPRNQKRVPRDLVLTPLTIATWFCGDGTHDEQGFLYFCTNGFRRVDVEWLADSLSAFVEARCTPVAARRNQFKVVVTKKDQALLLAEMIRPYIPDCCSYKLRFVREPGEALMITRHIVQGVPVSIHHPEDARKTLVFVELNGIKSIPREDVRGWFQRLYAGKYTSSGRWAQDRLQRFSTALAHFLRDYPAFDAITN